jgi:hypothetical protein
MAASDSESESDREVSRETLRKKKMQAKAQRAQQVGNSQKSALKISLPPAQPSVSKSHSAEGASSKQTATNQHPLLVQHRKVTKIQLPKAREPQTQGQQGHARPLGESRDFASIRPPSSKTGQAVADLGSAKGAAAGSLGQDKITQAPRQTAGRDGSAPVTINDLKNFMKHAQDDQTRLQQEHTKRHLLMERETATLRAQLTELKEQLAAAQNKAALYEDCRVQVAELEQRNKSLERVLDTLQKEFKQLQNKADTWARTVQCSDAAMEFVLAQVKFIHPGLEEEARSYLV